jgi:hypothetical protein
MILFDQTGGSLEDLARERKERMEAKKVFGGSPCLSSSLPHVPAQRICSLSYTNKPILRTIHHDLHLVAFHSKSRLFSYSPSSPHIKTTLSHKTHIFLPDLVASMVCFFPSFFLTFASNYRNPIYLSPILFSICKVY